MSLSQSVFVVPQHKCAFVNFDDWEECNRAISVMNDAGESITEFLLVWCFDLNLLLHNFHADYAGRKLAVRLRNARVCFNPLLLSLKRKILTHRSHFCRFFSFHFPSSPHYTPPLCRTRKTELVPQRPCHLCPQLRRHSCPKKNTITSQTWSEARRQPREAPQADHRTQERQKRSPSFRNQHPR